MNDSCKMVENSLKHPIHFWGIFFFFFRSLKRDFIAYRSSKVSARPDCIFEINQLWQSGFCRVYSNYYSSCSLEPEIIEIVQSSDKMYSNNMVNFKESTTILNSCTKKVWKLIEGVRECVCVIIYLYKMRVYIYIYIYIYTHPGYIIYSHTHIYIYIYIIYIYIIYTHTHTHTQKHIMNIYIHTCVCARILNIYS